MRMMGGGILAAIAVLAPVTVSAPAGATASVGTPSPVSRPFGVPASPAVNPAAAFNGTNFLVVWMDNGGVRAERVSASGKVLDPSGIEVFADNAAEVDSMSVSAVGSAFLVTVS